VLGGLFSGAKQSILLGVDISSSAVKMLELSRGGMGYRVEHYAVLPLPANSVTDDGIADIDVVAEVVANVHRKSRSKIKQCAVAVSGSAVITRVIEMPADLNEEELESQIEIEADQYIPYPLDEVALDFEVIAPVEGNEATSEVLVAACRRETVDARVEVLEFAELEAKVVDIKSYAIERSYELAADHYGMDDNSCVAIVDIGALTTNLSVLVGGETVFTREQTLGGTQLTDEIQRRYGLSPEEAELAKRKGGLPEDYTSEVLAPFLEDVGQQVSRSLQFFFSASEYDDVNLILLAGGSAAMPGIADLITEKLGMRAEVFDPFAGMTFNQVIDRNALQHDAPALMVACGLALRSFD